MGTIHCIVVDALVQFTLSCNIKLCCQRQGFDYISYWVFLLLHMGGCAMGVLLTEPAIDYWWHILFLDTRCNKFFEGMMFERVDFVGTVNEWVYCLMKSRYGAHQVENCLFGKLHCSRGCENQQ